MKSRNILFLSNGYAEDNIACCIIKSLLEEYPFLRIAAVPFVGEGLAFKKLDIETLGPCKRTPSDGFINGNLFYFLKDLSAGWLRFYLKKVKALKVKRSKLHFVVCIGDIFLVLTSALFIKKPIIFFPTAKSDYIKEHYWIEKWLMKRYCKLVFARDKKTALSLRSCGIHAVYAGNVMMDCLEITDEDFGIEKKYPVVGIVPGSKKEACENLKVILDAAEEIFLQKKGKVIFLLALAPSLDVRSIVNVSLREKDGWTLKNPTASEQEKGIVANLICPQGTLVKVIQARFGDVVNLSRVVIGTAGMASEQAVGLGKPVVAFPGKGPQITKKFLRIQRKLLGGAVFMTRNEAKAVADKVIELLDDSRQLAKVAKIGKERMGECGAAGRIAKIIGKELSRFNG
ncbi:hypothetical protein IBX65_01145 [Candidatus Aerophobetes bacterium]|nr:hypothetical protein [Candidatus Aerophobetes bacterium]